jgi:hypothetical protein
MYEVWFDTSTGEVAFDEPEISELVQRASNTAVPLGDIVLSEQFPFEKGQYERIPADRLDPVEGILLGKAIGQILMRPDNSVPLSKEHVRRLNILGLFPDINYIERRYGTLSNFRNLIKADHVRNYVDYESMTPEELLRHVLSAHAEISDGGPITRAEITLLHGLKKLPSYKYLRTRIGGTGVINEILGYPDISSWDTLDHVRYGVRVIQLNGPHSLTQTNINKLAKEHLGPWDVTIKKYFNNSWKDYVKAVYEECELVETVKNRDNSEEVANHFVRLDYANDTPDTNVEKRTIWARYQIAVDICGGGNRTLLKQLSLLPTESFVKKITEIHPHITLAHIETTAIIYDVEELLWPSLKPIEIKQPLLSDGHRH